MLLGRVERGLGNGDRGTEASDRHRTPLVRRQFGFLSGDHRRQQAIAQGEIFRFEIGLLGRGHRGGKRRRQLHARGGQFQRVPCDLTAAHEFHVFQVGLRRRASGSEPVRNQQRRLARGVAQQPGDLLDRQQLVDRGILMVDVGGKRRGQLVERLKQRVRRLHVFLGQRQTARGLWLPHFFPEFLLLRGQGFEQAIQLRHQRLLLIEFDRRELAKRVAHRGHFRVAEIAQIFFDIAIHRLIGIQQPGGGGPIGAQIMHRLEQVRRGIGDHRNAARQLQTPPGFPGVE